MRRWAVCGRMYVPRGVFGSLGMQGRHARPRGFIRLRAGRARSPPASRRWARGMRRSPPALHPPPIRAGPRAVAMPPPGKARARHGAHHTAAHCRAARRAPMGLAHGCCAHTSCAHTLSYARADRPCRPRMTSRASRLSAPRIRRGRSRRVHPRAGARHAPLAASRRVPTPGPPRIYARAARRPWRRTAVSSTPHSQASRRGRCRGAWQRSAPTKGLPARPGRARGDPVSHDACAADLAGVFAR
jgi:hypothetical protein